MILFKPEISILVVLAVNYVRGELKPDGENVCLQTQKYLQTVKYTENRPVTKTVKYWCWDIAKAFKCVKNEIRYEQVIVPRVFERTRIVPQCCEGYQKNAELTQCVPVCTQDCTHGHCSAPETCSCNSGYHGKNCDTPCLPNFWGENCREECKCQDEKNKCDPFSGECPLVTTTQSEETDSSTNTVLASDEKTYTTKLTTIPTTTETGSTAISTTTDTYETISTTIPTTADIYKTETTLTITEGSTNTMTTETGFKDVFSKIYSTTETSFTENTITALGKSETSFTESTITASGKSETTTKYFEISSQKTKTNVLLNTPTEPITRVEEENTKNSFVIEDVYETETNNKLTKTDEEFKEVNGKTTLTDESFTTKIFNTVDWENEQNKQNEDVDNFIPGDSKSVLNEKNKHFKIVHFVPSLTVVSGVTILLFIIAGRYIVVRKKRKAQKLALEKEEKLFYPEGKQKEDNTFTLNNFAENPVYLSQEEFQNTVPVLQTFKPLNADKTNETVFR